MAIKVVQEKKAVPEPATKKLDSSLRYIKGVGPQRLQLFERLGVRTVEEILYFFPRRYEDRTRLMRFEEVEQDAKCLLAGIIQEVRLIRTRRGPSILKVVLDLDGGACHGLWFNSNYLEKSFSRGQNVCFYGKVDKKKDRIEMIHPEFEFMDKSDGKRIHTGRIVPFYSLTKDLNQRTLRSLIYNVLVDVLPTIDEYLPSTIREKYQLDNRKFAIKAIHFPGSEIELKRAYRRLVFDEFFFIQLMLAMKKNQFDSSERGYLVDQKVLDEFLEILPFKPTQDQLKCMKDLTKDFGLDRPMQRLLQGDVGSGKTTVAAYGLFATARAGFQGALMAPTEILAQQHYLTLSRLFSPLGLSVSLLTNGIGEAERVRVFDDLKNGKTQIVVGTHALIQNAVQFKSLRLAVIDEQHKFGVLQREFLNRGSVKPNVLVMTATPIPQTLAMTLYGDMDLSVMANAPRGRGQVETWWVGSDQRASICEFVKKQLQEGRQAYVVYPAVDAQNDPELQSVTQGVKNIQKALCDFRVDLLHGKMSSKDKKNTMQRFKSKETHVLVATTVVEVGLDVPNASVMVIENAERFGLSQLHQLRGRIGRGKHRSVCVLLSDSDQEVAKERLSAFTRMESGFDIAEQDLKLRGPGDFIGKRQHGIPQIRIGDLIKDLSILISAREEAGRLAEEDPNLDQKEYKLLKKDLKRRFKKIEK